ncbi:hypothetical protein EV356DRAFT_519935 [Viridothelium virens]|uniref:Rhodopsin domain-containing protein n=1 Tax=Viridothelium virens TaxID=1048519 RepID=A0A6A6GYI0_VIRVR|nr:hypothetical protein EV356DRAFT_519935 [Viridothelium virens]
MAEITAHERHNQILIIGLTTTLLALCWILYCLRIVSRKVWRTPLWIDDWFMLFALFVCTMMSVLNFVGVRFGSGVHREHLDPGEYRKFQINLYVFMMGWALGVAVVKIGILIFYWRIFSIQSFRRKVLILGAGLLCASTAIFLTFMFQCTPIPRFWAGTDSGYCINQVAFYISGGTLNIVGDAAVLALPIHQVWILKASKQQRIALVFLFLLGGFVCITSIFRLIALNEIDPEDFSYTNVGGGLWSTVEVQVGFICANMPHLRPLFIKFFMPQKASTGGASGGSADRFRGYAGSGNGHAMLGSGNGFRKIHELRHGVVEETPTENGHSEDVDLEGYGSQLELAPIQQEGKGIAVHTHVRQEVMSPGENISESNEGWQNPQISTRIISDRQQR